MELVDKIIAAPNPRIARRTLREGLGLTYQKLIFNYKFYKSEWFAISVCFSIVFIPILKLQLVSEIEPLNKIVGAVMAVYVFASCWRVFADKYVHEMGQEHFKRQEIRKQSLIQNE